MGSSKVHAAIESWLEQLTGGQGCRVSWVWTDCLEFASSVKHFLRSRSRHHPLKSASSTFCFSSFEITLLCFSCLMMINL